MRVSSDQFAEIVNAIEPGISKQSDSDSGDQMCPKDMALSHTH